MIRKILFIIFSISSLPLLSQKIQQNISVKEYAKSAPYFISRSPEKLTEYLTAKDSSEAQTVLNIYTWITNNIKYDIKVLGKIKTKSYSLKQTLRKKKGICSQFSKLFIILCNNAGISAREVVGYSRGLQYHEGDAFYETDHSWVSVKLDSAWFLIDPTWGSGSVIPKKRKVAEFLYKWFGKPYINDKYKFVQVPNYSFLFIEPSKLIETHLPADPAWQLIEFPISVSTFENTQWKKYVAVRDSSYSKEIERSEYVNQLNSYEYLSPNQYLAKTANQANNFNPKNYKLLGISFFANAPSISKMSPDSIIYTSNQEAIIDLKSAIHFSKKHQKTIKTETRKTIREQKRKIRKELEEPNQLCRRYILQRIRQGSAFLEKAETRLNSYKENISRLKYILENRNYGSLTIDKFPRKRPKLILINRGRIRDESASLVIIKDSVKRLMAELKDLLLKRNHFTVS